MKKKSPVEMAIDAVVRCVICNAKYGECDCHENKEKLRCPICLCAFGETHSDWCRVSQEDMSAIASDWKAVGNYLREAMGMKKK